MELMDDGQSGGVKISCPKLVDLELRGLIANNFFFKCLDSLSKAEIEPKLTRNIKSVLFPGISHVEHLLIDLYFFSQCRTLSPRTLSATTTFRKIITPTPSPTGKSKCDHEHHLNVTLLQSSISQRTPQSNVVTNKYLQQQTNIFEEEQFANPKLVKVRARSDDWASYISDESARQRRR
ncbi:unnamed protein product [Lactuca virosa]|uniref:Uncharacterized protein n=1 Tax=Lactuca virosa TaxID=75947 RepID=A0AAU9MYF6_9ASTR|nr:unnamed protein product [Lactuca virosa]